MSYYCQAATSLMFSFSDPIFGFMENAKFEDFQEVDFRVGTILKAEEFPEAKKPAYKLTIDFGDLGTKQSSAQITKRYKPSDLVGKQVMAVFNFPPMKIAGFKSEVLVLGASDEADDIILISPENELTNGSVLR
ncbi:MAG: tRNA-binding protein [Bacteroidia bacterium]|jgi:tRNA-binding protein